MLDSEKLKQGFLKTIDIAYQLSRSVKLERTEVGEFPHDYVRYDTIVHNISFR